MFSPPVAKVRRVLQFGGALNLQATLARQQFPARVRGAAYRIDTSWPTS